MTKGGVAKYIKFIFTVVVALNWPSNYIPQVSVVNQLDMQVVVCNVPPTVVEQNKEQLIG